MNLVGRQMRVSKISWEYCQHVLKRITMLVLLLLTTTASQPLSMDSRIKTYIYNPNDDYRMVVQHGFQSHIEFGNSEEIETISLGDTFAWQVSPIGRRLFIKPLEENMHTNMTVITTKRSYQFEIISVSADDVTDPLLAYVVRFYYPEVATNQTNKQKNFSNQADEQLE